MELPDYHGDTDRILFDILQELKKLNESKETKQEVKEEINSVPTGVPCKYCGGTHDNRYQVAACAKKSKRGVSNGI